MRITEDIAETVKEAQGAVQHLEYKIKQNSIIHSKNESYEAYGKDNMINKSVCYLLYTPFFHYSLL